jgi:hypothetical protein
MNWQDEFMQSSGESFTPADHDFVEFELNQQLSSQHIDTSGVYRPSRPVGHPNRPVDPPRIEQNIQRKLIPRRDGIEHMHDATLNTPMYGPGCQTIWGASSSDSIIIIMLVIIACLLMCVRSQLNQVITYNQIESIIKSNTASTLTVGRS